VKTSELGHCGNLWWRGNGGGATRMKIGDQCNVRVAAVSGSVVGKD
jgi:hypothetical protein